MDAAPETVARGLTAWMIRPRRGRVGVALLVTTVVLVLGFCVLGTSGYRPSSHIGWLSATTLVLALVADFFFLPPLLMMLDRPKRRPERSGEVRE